MPLNNEQIETLFAFTKKKSVQYYDLQLELVDHLASSIEEEMDKDAKLSFENALQKVYSRFGLFGFAHVVQEREKHLRKQSWKLFWKALGSYFTVPRIAFTILLFSSTYLLVPLFSVLFLQIAVVSVLTYSSVMEIVMVLQRKRTDVKPLLIVQNSNFFLPFPIWCGWFIPKLFEWKANPVHPISFSIIITIIIVLHLAATQVSRKIRQKAKELYPEAFSVA